MDAIISFIESWGYIAILLGSMVEGESIILTASFLAAQDYLSLPKVMVVAFWGTLLADQGLFFIGRYYGPWLFERFPRLYKRAQFAFDLLKKWDTIYILTFRFIYGVRIISSVVIGASNVTTMRFLILNLISAIVWTLVSCSIGYLLGEAVAEVLDNFTVYRFYILAALLGIIILGITIYYLWRKKKWVT